jgi:hypothetical protein
MSIFKTAGFMLVLAGIAHPPLLHAEAEKSGGMMKDQATVTDVIRATATVEAVDYAARTVTLKTESGEKEIVEVSPEVKRFREVKKGDRVQVQVYRAIAAKMSRHKNNNEIRVQGEVAKASPQDRPGIAGRNDISSTVTVNEVDLKNNLVTVTGPAGNTVKLAVSRPPMQAFIKQLKPGDRVDVTYTEAVAISLEPKNEK